jgi:hypothetical protein
MQAGSCIRTIQGLYAHRECRRVRCCTFSMGRFSIRRRDWVQPPHGLIVVAREEFKTLGPCTHMLPSAILRRRKRGFAVNVVDDWIRKTTRSGSLAAILSEDTPLRDFIRTDAVSRLLDSHISGESDNHKLLFCLAVCQQWLRTA